MYQESIITTKTQVKEIVSTGVTDVMVKIVASEEYDLELS